MKKYALSLIIIISFLTTTQAQTFTPNYDESKVGTYTLPNPLLTVDKKKITTAPDWKRYRAHWLNQFAENVYGVTPKRVLKVRYDTLDVKTVLDGAATRQRINIVFTEFTQLHPIEILMFVPTNAPRPVPVAMGLNFCGNHGVVPDVDIPLSTRWVRDTPDSTIMNNRFTELSRGRQTERWQVKELIANGIAVATSFYGDTEEDHPEGWRNGIRQVLGDSSKPNNWGAIGAWAWQLMRMMDYITTVKAIDYRQSFLTGHSRLGKTALWAAAQDGRFSAVNPNNSGEGGAALARRHYGETVKRLNDAFPHWFCRNYRQYMDKENDMPTDQHILLALIAPRPLYVTSADEDRWADPKGEFLSLKAAEPVYALFGIEGLKATDQPPVNQPTGTHLRYHIRKGKHDITAYDWAQYVDFIKYMVKKK